jgi:hypothetical protein
MERIMYAALMVVITMVAVGAVWIMNGDAAADCTALSTWASPAVAECVEGGR